MSNPFFAAFLIFSVISGNLVYAQEILVDSHVTSTEKPAFHDDYATEAEVPEPMLYDLVRRLGAHQGEFEFNTLFWIDGSTQPKDFRYAPEVEVAIFDGVALELELPFKGTSLDAVKGAAQFTFGRTGFRKQHIHGLQFLYEYSLSSQVSEWIATYVFGHRVTRRWSYLLMLGPAVAWSHLGGSWTLSAIANYSLFFNLSREIDIGLEINWHETGSSTRQLIVLPQLHVLLPHDWKIQAGMGVDFHHTQFEMTSGMRLIKEFN